jgi:hypothetical protein
MNGGAGYQVPMRGAQLLAFLACMQAVPALALNKQGARTDDDEEQNKGFPVNLSGYLFAGGFLFNPTYAARPNNTGLAAFRFGLHLDLDLYRRWLTISYDENTFTDGGSERRNLFLPTEHDHIVGLLSTIGIARHTALTLAVHYEIDSPATEPSDEFQASWPLTHFDANRQPQPYPAGYTQSYVDAYARITYEAEHFTIFAALGGFLYNPSYAARPDNAGLALFRYQLHGEVSPLPWLSIRLDFNAFTDREEGWFTPTELDVLSEIALKWRSFELHLDGEADLGIGSYSGVDHPSPTPGLRQFYLASVVQWSFDIGELVRNSRQLKKARAPFPF